MRQERRASTVSIAHLQLRGSEFKRLNYEFHTSDEFVGTNPRRLPLNALLQGFVAHTTSHGVPHVDNARGESP